MISEQTTPSVTVQVTNNPLLSNFTLKDETCLIAFNKSINNSTISMTKQLATTISATTISNSTLAPTTVSPTNSLSFVISPTNKGACIVQKDDIPSATSASNFSKTTIPITSNLIGILAKKTFSSSSSNDASGRSAALERAYVHDVYENCEEPTGPIRPRVAQFLSNLDPGSVVCDVGCGSGRYLTQCNPGICTIGVDRCYRLSNVARKKGGEVALCDNLELPFRDESFDAVLSLAVVHHFATTERRVNALRELARILRIGGRVVITVWALEQHHRRFESQDVLIPWQPPKNRNFTCSDEEDDDNFLPPYHAYIEDSTNSSRSAGDGDSSSLSSSSPGESCYSFVRRAIQKLAGGRKHPWFLDSWTSKETKNDSSLDYEDAKDLPIELRRLEDFEDFCEPPLSSSLKSRSLGSILNPPPRQIVRSRSSVPSLGGPLMQTETSSPKTQAHNAQFHSISDGNQHGTTNTGVSPATTNGHVTTNLTAKSNNASFGVSLNGSNGVSSAMSRRPKLIKQKQSLCDEDYQLPENSFHILSNYNSNSHIFNNSLLYMKSGCYHGSTTDTHLHQSHESATQANSIFLRKQSSLNEELMAGNRIREKERLRKRIQKQISLNEAFLCRSALLSKRLQVIREGFTSKMKNSTNSLERVTKNGFTKIMQNFKTTSSTFSGAPPQTDATQTGSGVDNVVPSIAKSQCQHQHQHHHHHHHHHYTHQQQHNHTAPPTGFRAHLPHILRKQTSNLQSAEHIGNKFGGPVIYCNSAECVSGSSACYCSTYHHGCSNCSATADGGNVSENADTDSRRHSRESGSDSSKDSSLQSDTSIESEDSFASVIFIPKPEQHQQQLNYQQQHQNSNSSSSNSSSSNGGVCQIYNGACCSFKGCAQQSTHQQQLCKGNCSHSLNSGHQGHNAGHQQRIPSLPTSPLVMPCPPTPAHSPAAAQTAITSPPQTMASVTAAMAILTPASVTVTGEHTETTLKPGVNNKSRFSFDEAHIKQHENKNHDVSEHIQPVEQSKTPKTQQKDQPKISNESSRKLEPVIPTITKITRQVVNELPPIPKFRKQQSLQLQRSNFPIVRRSSGTGGAVPSIPKLLSLEIFNPATDDLDSDSSEPSSPDSIDSVISAPKSATINATSIEEHSKEDEATDDGLAQFDDNDDKIKLEQLNQVENVPHNIINDDDCRLMIEHSSAGNKQAQNCSEFAEQLNAQLLREIEDKNNRADCFNLDSIGDIGEYLEDPFSGNKKRNGEQRDLIALRDELRERRLMLANLSTQPSLQQSPTSSSTSSLSSQTRSFTIHEEDEEEDEEENERSYSLQLYENCKISKFNYKRNRHYNLNAETAYLLQDDGDSSAREEDELDDFDHDVILEEDEEAVAAAECDSEQVVNHKIKDRSTHNESRKTETSKGRTCTHATEQKRNKEGSLENRQSTESCDHSNSSTTSLDSPSQGGSTTHHRYYHVFREGELDALINHHVASLHIVSSYYERASWCVVAEKVQVWTI